MKNNITAIAITLGEHDGTFISMTVWAANSISIYQSYDLTSEESKKWLSKIQPEEGKRYYSLIN